MSEVALYSSRAIWLFTLLNWIALVHFTNPLFSNFASRIVCNSFDSSPPLLFPRGFPFPRLISFTLSLLFRFFVYWNPFIWRGYQLFFLLTFTKAEYTTLGIFRIFLAEIPNKESGSIIITYYGKFKQRFRIHYAHLKFLTVAVRL